MGVHDGHRERLRARFAEHGLESFNELNALELLLCYAIPRRDTNELAHRLLDAFGSLSGVFQASMQELTSIPGIGENSAMLILMVPQIVKKAHVSKAKETKIIRNSTDAGNYLLPYFLDEQDEIVMMLCLDNKRAVICCREMGRGVVNCVDAKISSAKASTPPFATRLILSVFIRPRKQRRLMIQCIDGNRLYGRSSL